MEIRQRGKAVVQRLHTTAWSNLWAAYTASEEFEED